MKMAHFLFLSATAVSGFLAGNLLQAPVVAQAPPPAAQVQSPARFQISAFAGPGQNGNVFHGCYTVDTATGELWITIPDQPAKAGVGAGAELVRLLAKTSVTPDRNSNGTAPVVRGKLPAGCVGSSSRSRRECRR